jgi:hypothetical protein
MAKTMEMSTTPRLKKKPRLKTKSREKATEITLTAATLNCRAAHGRGAFLVLLLLFLVTGCASLFPKATVQQPESAPIFPPRTAMESGDYKGFFAQNEEVLKTCDGSKKGCDVALFNMGFLYAYSVSPYYNPQKATSYFEQLTREHPGTTLAYQAEAWLDLLKRDLTTQKGQHRMRKQIKSKDATINQLQEQIQRSREIDQQMDRKERELLQ